jgi:hypothetical protein
MLIHALLSLSTIALYREYMAFLPWNVTTPIGPRDEPRITEELPADQQDYWITQARKCFGAAKDFADLLRPAKSANALVDSPIVGWATYIVAWCGELSDLWFLRNRLKIFSFILRLLPTDGPRPCVGPSSSG